MAKKSGQLFLNPAEKNKLYDWYTSTADEFPLEKGILFCQKQNISLDQGLRKRYKNTCLCLIVAMSCFIFGIGIMQNETVQQLLSRLAFVAPLICWLYTTTRALNSDISRLNKLHSEAAGDTSKTIDSLQEIQGNIMEHRKNCCFTPNWFYAIFKNKDESISQQAAEIERNSLN